MSVRPFRDINRKKTKVINVGNVKIGGENPISVQSMTNTLTTDIKSTIKQINEIHSEGADLVRVSCPDESSSKALKEIVKNVNVPLIADIHYHYKRAIEAAENGASCLRINPGNIGEKKKINEVLKAAKDNNCSIRIGVNAASPGPFTTQPIIDRVTGLLIWDSFSSKTLTVSITWKPCLAQDGHEIIFTPRCLKFKDFNISLAILTSFTGSSESEILIVSPIPSKSNEPTPIEDFTLPDTKLPASVIPKWRG